MSVYALKSRFQNLLRPAVSRLAEQGRTANQITLAACAMSLVIGALLALCLSRGWLWALALLPLCLFVRMAMNAMDGMLAREHRQQSPLGGYLNELTDVLSDAALYLPFLWLPVAAWQVCVLVFLAALSEFAGVLGQVHGNGRRYDGPMGKSDRALLFGVLAVAILVYPQVLSYLNYVFTAANLLLLWTIYRRIKLGLQTRTAA